MTTGWYTPEIFYFNIIIKSNFEIIRKEAISLLLKNFFYDHSQSDENLIVKGRKIANKWKAFDIVRGEKFTPESQYCPNTRKILGQIPEIMNCKKGKVYFSLIPPGGMVRPHSSGLKREERTRHQLCLIQPTNIKIDEVYFELNEIRNTWKLGEILSFDDSYMHSAKNMSNENRLVLLYDSLSL